MAAVTLLFAVGFRLSPVPRSTIARHPPPAATVKLTGKEASRYLSQSKDGRSLLQALNATRFRWRWQEQAPSGQDRAGYVAINDEQNFSTSFDAEGGAYVRSNGEQKWLLGLKLKSYGYGKEAVDVPPIVSRQINENRIEYERSSFSSNPQSAIRNP